MFPLHRKYILGWAFFLLLLGAYPSLAVGARKEKILVLHSYHQGMEWTDSITDGIQSVFQSLDGPYEIYYEYLDTKRNSGEDYDKKLTRLFTAKMKNIQYKAVIPVDNNALLFINKNYDYLNGEPPIIFCGINNFQPELVDNLPFVTGITEETDIAGNFDLMLRLHPDRTRIVVILDGTTTGMALKKPLAKVISKYGHRVRIDTFQDFSLEEALSFVSGLGAEDMIFLLTFTRDRGQRFISYTEGIALLKEAAGVPIYGPWDFYLGKGIVGGVITSGFYQGKSAARLALRILRGENPENIPVVTRSNNPVMVDFNQLRAFDIDSGLLPERTVVINRPPRFYEKHNRILFGVCLAVILVLGVSWWRLLWQKREQSHLKEMNLTLDKLVQQKTARLMATNQALHKIAITDDLTGLFNRGYLLKQLADLAEFPDGHGEILSIILVDVDNFKWINDTFGHDFGDKVLKQVSAILKSALRERDLVGRYGGEEFLVILPGTDLEAGKRIAQRIRENVQFCQWDFGDFRITLSGGVVQYRGGSVESLLKRADRLLYQAKDRGRNRMEHYLL